MPVITDSKYNPPFLLKSGQFQTVWPTLTRKVSGVKYSRERIDTPDGDFLDLDWSTQDSEQLVILLHGLEGSSNTHYMRGMAKAFYDESWDVLAMNFRGCSGEMNRLPRSYHSGATEDLRTVLEHVQGRHHYEVIVPVGFSLGGNLTLKYLGESGRELPEQVKAGVGISVPCDLADSSKQISEPQNYLYEKRFLLRLKRKIRLKAGMFPEDIDYDKVRRIKKLKEFDDLYTAPIHGFEDAQHYYAECSARRYLADIRCPTLILSAANDPILTEECYPFSEAEANTNITLEVPSYGGHVGFMSSGNSSRYWHEKRVTEYLKENEIL
ncbi:MAG: 2-succinyl-6-hydroxy-2,4-cyclohexadiene-1-carboxylate synthase [Candidatus Marinimicrobia bacterium]|nr:2-succinyl-6-hydroxy-2,4-cyclohexadiene-1-carboxylate synthase [Candidatus Neomarinimicrobiota bacterium]